LVHGLNRFVASIGVFVTTATGLAHAGKSKRAKLLNRNFTLESVDANNRFKSLIAELNAKNLPYCGINLNIIGDFILTYE
jgi:hypothetical protein